MMRATRVVSGPLALKMHRHAAALDGIVGLEILSLPQLAARLAGGFARPAGSADVQPAIRAALDKGGFAELTCVAPLPGMVRAVQRTLSAIWLNDFALDASGASRLDDLARIDSEVRGRLPPGVMAPPDLRDAALARCVHARRLLGSIELVGFLDVDQVWRPLLAALADEVPVAWISTGEATAHWFPGVVHHPPLEPEAEPTAVVCADPHVEVVEALRWSRALMAAGVAAADIGIAALTTDPWDETMLVLSRSAGLPVHFTHGTPALEHGDGQACSALADVLLRGLSQARVRRLLDCAPTARRDLPNDWSKGLKGAAGLFTVPQWSTALAAARPKRESGDAAERALLPRLELLSEGPAAAVAAGEAFLSPQALALWREALRAAPAEALDVSLLGVRVPDPGSPASAVSWGPAWHLAAAPRPFARLLGLTGRAWPRSNTEDPLLPDHVLPRRAIEQVPRAEQDERVFRNIARAATKGLVLSRSRRSSEGTLLAPSRLFPPSTARDVSRVITPEHAFSEADRLLARPKEAASMPTLALADACWRAWASKDQTPYDGRFPAQHPVVRSALEKEQSATSLRHLLRDPLGFVWRDALGWSPRETHTDVLSLDRPAFGELVHDLIRRTVETLEPAPGLNRATREEIERAMRLASAAIAEAWPAERPVPPPVLWRRTVDEAARLALAGLLVDEQLQPGTRSWAEVRFGAGSNGEPPWDEPFQVNLGGLLFGGSIDRLDLRGDGVAARVTDYKSGSAPRNMGRVTIGGGTEVQRVIYAAAVRQGLSDVRQVVSRLVYLRDGPAHHGLQGHRLDDAVAETARFIEAAQALLLAGSAPPGPDIEDRFNEMRLALPADLDLYRRRKAAALATAAGEVASYWGRP